MKGTTHENHTARRKHSPNTCVLRISERVCNCFSIKPPEQNSASSSAQPTESSEASSAQTTEGSASTGAQETSSLQAAASPDANILPVTTTPTPGESPAAISNTEVVTYIAADPAQYQHTVGTAQHGTVAFNYNGMNCYLVGGEASCNGFDSANNVNFFFSDHGFTEVPASQSGSATDMAPAQNTLPDGYQLSSDGASCQVGQHTLICSNASGTTFGVDPEGYFNG